MISRTMFWSIRNSYGLKTIPGVRKVALMSAELRGPRRSGEA